MEDLTTKMAISNDDNSLHLGFLSNNVNITFEHDIISTTPDVLDNVGWLYFLTSKTVLRSFYRMFFPVITQFKKNTGNTFMLRKVPY